MFGREILKYTIIEGRLISPIIKKINHNYKKRSPIIPNFTHYSKDPP